jgi:hypothetical protein
MFPRPSRVIPAAALAASLFAVPAAEARLPTAAEYSYKWKKYGCFETDNGYRSIATIKTWVNQVEYAGVRYYQKVTVQIDRLAGYGSASATWRKVDGRTYDWSRFTNRDLPTYSTSAVRTGMQPDTAMLSAKATVRLKRVRKGYDTTVWSYKVRSPQFSCTNTITGVSI